MEQRSVGGTELHDLVQSMSPELHDGVFCFTLVPYGDTAVDTIMKLVDTAEMLFREREGWTVILLEALAIEMDLKPIFLSRKISLNVHSSLDAVGFLAAIITRLAETIGVGIEPVSGYFHDHLFVPKGTEAAIMHELQKMAQEKDSPSPSFS